MFSNGGTIHVGGIPVGPGSTAGVFQSLKGKAGPSQTCSKGGACTGDTVIGVIGFGLGLGYSVS